MSGGFQRLAFDVDALRAKMNARCQHPNARVVWTDWSSYGAKYHRRQLREFCDDCGWLLPNQLKHTSAAPDTPEVSFEEVTRGSCEREEQYRQAQAAYEKRSAEYEANREKRRAEYAEYLQSDDWWDGANW